jgi:uncharacterized membrane protein
VVPVLLAGAGTALAWLTIRADEAGIGEPWSTFLVEASVDSSRSLLTTVAGATASVAGIVFALTAVAVQLASSTYSPRVIQGYMRDGFQQSVIGLVAGTFAFALLTLASIDETGGTEPRLTVTLGVGLGVASFLVIIVMIDHVVRSLRADSIIRRLTEETLAAIRRYHPEKAALDPGDFTAPSSESIVVRSTRRGWLRAIDRDGTLDRLPPGSIVRLDTSVGALLHDGAQVATVWSDRLDVEHAEAIVRDGLVVGRSRTLDQDPIYGMRLLADVALRALSPGINDPTTAVTVVRHLTGLLHEVFTRDLPPRVYQGEDGRRLYEPHRPNDADFLRVALREVRLFAKGQPEVQESIAALLADLAAATEPDGRRHALLAQEATDLLTTAASLSEADRRRVADRLGDLAPA